MLWRCHLIWPDCFSVTQSNRNKSSFRCCNLFYKYYPWNFSWNPLLILFMYCISFVHFTFTLDFYWQHKFWCFEWDSTKQKHASRVQHSNIIQYTPNKNFKFWKEYRKNRGVLYYVFIQLRSVFLLYIYS